ncbi:probable RNA helicase armi [Anopheles stephensi]|uniref:probable RNA helicase armi n=1 Tax=Anopheles stephensi TaxID=30069 RepID=UPI0016589E09|nr:probable RNA helicase armi [Anopheles stephensi]XP_035916808.1 probable RNA helicase armi [Anopheles stephensi]
MFRLTAWFIRKAWEKTPNQQLSLAENIRLYEEMLQQEDENDGKKKQEQIVKQAIEPTDCFQTTGTITEVRADYIIIDGIYFVPKALLKNTEAGAHVEENTKVQFLANRKTDPLSGETSTKVVKIISILGNHWSGGDTAAAAATEEEDWTQQTDTTTTNATTYYKSNRRREPGTVIGNENDILMVETDAGDPISVNIDKTSMSFVPAMGDYVTLDCVVQMDGKFVDFKGEVLEVVGIEPTRIVSDIGTIVAIEQEGGEIRATASNSTVIYQATILTDYRPKTGDRVEYKAVENKHVRMRCISVKLLAPAVMKTLENNPSQAPFRNGNTRPTNSLWQDKHGIRITGEFDVTLKDGQDRACRKVVIKNESDKQHKILKMLGPKSDMPQVCLKSPVAHAQTFLFPGESVEYEFEISGGGIFGRNEESCIWCFGGAFRIGRIFRITVGDTNDERFPAATTIGGGSFGRVSYCKKQLALLNMRRAPGTVLAGRGFGNRMNFIANPLPAYNVPSELFDILLTTQSRAEVKNILERAPYCLNEPLSPLNYSRLMKNFIYLEEIALQIEFRKHDIDRAHFTAEDSFLALEVPNIVEARPSIMVGDAVRATAPWTKDTTIYQGIIHRVLHSRVLLKFDQTFHARYNGESYAIQFTFGRTVFRKQQHAIKRVQQTMGFEYLFPERLQLQEPLLNVRLHAGTHDMILEEKMADGKTVSRGLPWCNAALNRYQKQAVVNVLRGEARPTPHIIFGPPGTGKTITIIELIHQLVANVPSSRVIVVTPSNSAAYLITERLARGGILQPGDFIRLVAMSQVERESVPEHLAQYCATVDVADERSTFGDVLVTESGLRMKFQAKHIGRHRVTISTCLGIGSLMMMKFDPNHFTHVIIDEAGQAMEPETLIPICQVGRTSGTVVLVGDPKQLGHSVHFADGEQWNSNLSLLERLLDRRLYSVDRRRFSEEETAGYDPRLVTMLRINYRSIPAVLSLYNDLFYGSTLQPYRPAVTEQEVELIAAVRDILRMEPTTDANTARDGFFFCGINGTNKQSPESPSWFNPAEACMVHKIVERLYRGGRCGPDDIGIITPYVMQVRSIRRIFDAASLESPKIGSVEEFQGQERKVIILSAVRSSAVFLARDATAKLGFIAAPKRINVAISRAKVVLVVVGNPHLLATDDIWGSLLQRAVNGKTYCGCSLPSTLMERSRDVAMANRQKSIQGGGHNLLQRQYDDDDEDETEQY